MNELSLFTGAGGGIWGSKLLGWRTIGYVEKEKYCCDILARRIADGIFTPAPIYCGDINDFNQELAIAYRDMVDVITAGFPCQPFSVAGKGQAEDDERNCWPQTIEAIRIIRPRYALLENVPGLLAHRYFGRILGDLAESGYDARWCIVSAAEVGAPHRRERLWILANSCKLRCDSGRTEQPLQGIRAYGETSKVADANKPGLERCREPGQCFGKFSVRSSSKEEGELADPPSIRCGSLESSEQKGKGRKGSCGKTSDSGNSGRGIWWKSEPELGRVAHGVADRVNRLKALGNGQVPLVVKTAWERLIQ